MRKQPTELDIRLYEVKVRAFEDRLAHWQPCRVCYVTCTLMYPVVVAGACFATAYCFWQGWGIAGFFAGVVTFCCGMDWNCADYARPPKAPKPKFEEDD